jgi:CRP/FNR family transcriptional regulator, anaerobic regulatory protein
MYEPLLQKLNQVISLNPQQQQDLCRCIHPLEFPKAAVILAEGEVSDYLYFVAKGGVRSAYSASGRDVTRWLCFEGDFATSYFSFVYRQPSEDSIIAIADCELLAIRYDDLQHLSRQDQVWIDLNRRLLEHYYTALLQRIAAFQTQSTAERYRSLLQEHPDIEDKVALGHIASYLGMTQETFSRLRTRFRKRQKST